MQYAIQKTSTSNLSTELECVAFRNESKTERSTINSIQTSSGDAITYSLLIPLKFRNLSG
jgi:hypothetical protein